MSGLGTAMLIGITSMTGLLKGSNWAELLSLSHTHIHTHTHTHIHTHTPLSKESWLRISSNWAELLSLLTYKELARHTLKRKDVSEDLCCQSI